MLDNVRLHLRAALKHQKNELGFNLAAVRYIQSGVNARKTKDFIDEAEYKTFAETGSKKRGFATLA